MANGHVDAWSYTPRQLQGFMHFLGKRQTREAALQLSIGASAARGDPRRVRESIRKWSKD